MSIPVEECSIFEVAQKLYEICVSETTLNEAERFYPKDFMHSSINYIAKLKWHTVILNLFACETACCQKFRDSAILKSVTESLYRQFIASLYNQTRDKEIVQRAMKEIDSYATAIKGKTLDQQLLSVGSRFADLIEMEEGRILFTMAGTAIYSEFLFTITNRLSQIKIRE